MLDDVIIECLAGAFSIYACLCVKWKISYKLRLAIAWVVIGCLIYREIPMKRNNFYTLIDVPVKATKTEINSAFRQASKLYHPDKNPDKQNAAEIFMRLKKGHEILMHDVKRSNYNRFGDFKEDNVDEKTAIMVVVMAMAAYTLFFVVAYFCTFPKPMQLARQVVLLYNIGCFCLELQFRFSEDDDTFSWAPLYNEYLPFERANFLSRIFPTILGLSMILSCFVYVDYDENNIFLLKGVLNSNRVLHERMLDIIQYTGVLKTLNTQTTQQAKIAAEKLNAEISSVKASQVATALKISNSIKNGEENKETDDTAQNNKVKEPPAEKPNAIKEFVDSLTDAQKDQFSKVLGITKTAEKKESGVQWAQIIMWGIIFAVWLYYK